MFRGEEEVFWGKHAPRGLGALFLGCLWQGISGRHKGGALGWESGDLGSSPPGQIQSVCPHYPGGGGGALLQAPGFFYPSFTMWPWTTEPRKVSQGQALLRSPRKWKGK